MPAKVPSVVVPKFPLIKDPLRRITIPRDLSSWITVADDEMEAAAGGMTDAGVERIWQSVLRLYRHGVYPALTVCIRREGEIVLHRSIGWARGVGPNDERGPRVAARPDTPICVFSAAKAVTATLVHMLDEQGLLHVGDRVAEYVPEFNIPGKHRITIDHVLSHRAGIPNLPAEMLDLDRLDDREYMVECMRTLAVRTRPGTKLAYHAITGGFVLGEVVRAVTGKSIREVLAEQILEPMGMRWTNYGVAPADLEAVAINYSTGPLPVRPVSSALVRALGLHPDEVTRVSNDPRFLTGIVPAGNIVSTAEEMSRFYEMLRVGGWYNGTKLISGRTIRRAIVETSHHEFDRTLGMPLRHSSGFMLGSRALNLYGPGTDSAFGHLGFTNVITWTDPRRAISAAVLTTGKPVLGPHIADFWNLTRRIGIEAPRVENPELFTADL
jgi:CubicO group peptidase (beta-lactamase class C family)